MPGKAKSKPQAASVSWASSAGVRRSMQSNRPRDTKPELRLRSAAHRLGLRYLVGARPLPRLNRTADLLFTKAKIAVFVDGCYWHGCPQHHTVAKTNAKFWADKVDTNRRRDRETTALLEEEGWLVIRVWEHEPMEEAAAMLYNAWKQRCSAMNGPESSSQRGAHR